MAGKKGMHGSKLKQLAKVEDAFVDGMLEITDAITRSFVSGTDTDTTKVRQFQHQSAILSKPYNNYSDESHRIGLCGLSGIAWFIVRKLAEDTVLDGWDLLFDPDREYDDKAKEAIMKRYNFINKSLNNLMGDDINTILIKILEVAARDGYGCIYPGLGSVSTNDAKSKTVKTLKKLQVFPAGSLNIQNSDMDKMGVLERLKIKVQLQNGTRDEPVDIKKDHAIMFKGPHIDNQATYVGASVLERCMSYIIMIEWTAYSGADYANNRGAFLWLKRLLPNSDSTKLQALHTKLMYIFTRNGAVTGPNDEIANVGPGGTAVDIPGILAMLYKLIATATGVPVNKLEGAQAGAIASAKEDRIAYYPVLRAKQVWLKPIFKKIIELIDPTFFSDNDLDIEFKLQINMSESERADLLAKQLGNIKSQVDILAALNYTIGEIINVVEMPELLPPFPPIGAEGAQVEDPRNKIKLAERPDVSVAMPEEAPAPEFDTYSVSDHLVALIQKTDEDINAFCGGAGIKHSNLAKILKYAAIKGQA